MSNQAVTLTITASKGNSNLYTSDIRLFNTLTTQVNEIRKVKYDQSYELFIGNLKELRDSHLLIDTFAHISDKHNEIASATIRYEIKYGLEIVENSSVELHFANNIFASLGFRFPFCPRYPFC